MGKRSRMHDFSLKFKDLSIERIYRTRRMKQTVIPRRASSGIQLILVLALVIQSFSESTLSAILFILFLLLGILMLILSLILKTNYGFWKLHGLYIFMSLTISIVECFIAFFDLGLNSTISPRLLKYYYLF